jgi:hypothetical protein
MLGFKAVGFFSNRNVYIHDWITGRTIHTHMARYDQKAEHEPQKFQHFLAFEFWTPWGTFFCCVALCCVVLSLPQNMLTTVQNRITRFLQSAEVIDHKRNQWRIQLCGVGHAKKRLRDQAPLTTVFSLSLSLSPLPPSLSRSLVFTVTQAQKHGFGVPIQALNLLAFPP